MVIKYIKKLAKKKLRSYARDTSDSQLKSRYQKRESESMTTFGWDQMTDWWDKQLGDEGDLWHRTLIDPPLLHLVGEVEGVRLLDLACGNGYLSRRFARQGAIVTGVDANEPLIERARMREAQEP